MNEYEDAAMTSTRITTSNFERILTGLSFSRKKCRNLLYHHMKKHCRQLCDVVKEGENLFFGPRSQEQIDDDEQRRRRREFEEAVEQSRQEEEQP